KYSTRYFLMFEFSSVSAIALNDSSFVKSISYQGLFTVWLLCQELPKSSSLAKSIMFMSSLQLELVACFFARLCEIMGASVNGSLPTVPSFFQMLPII